MEESHIEGVANHDDPESCAGGRKAVGEALTGARMGRVLSREINAFGMSTPLRRAEDHTHNAAIARRWAIPRGRRPLARAEPSCARTGRSLDSPVAEGAAGCIGKAKAAIR
jgi:hypothetical protein